MRILVTGGSGFLGINLIRMLLAQNYSVTNIDFAPFTYVDCKDKITMVAGDIRNHEAVDQAMSGVDAVIHCAAALPLYSERDILTTDVDGTRNVLDAARKQGVRHFVHISSTAVYGVPDHHPILETDPINGVGAYGKAKILAEQSCIDYRSDQFPVMIIRPKSFIGPERLGVFALLYDWALTGHNFPILGNGKNPYQLLDVEDLCDIIIKCLDLPVQIFNDVYNIGAAEYTTIGEDFQAVLDIAGHGKKIVSIPVGPAIALLKTFESIGCSPLYQWVYDTVSKESFVSIEKAKESLGFSPKYSNKDALIRNYQWYISNIDSFKEQSGVSHRMPWKQGILRIGKCFF